MQYFFHKTSMADNPKMEALLEELGVFAYAIYNRYLEDVCRHGHVEIEVIRTEGEEPKVISQTWIGEVSPVAISRKLRIPDEAVERILKKIFRRYSVKILKKTQFYWIVSHPKVVDIMDEYTRKLVRKALRGEKSPVNVRTISGQCPVNVRQEGKGREGKGKRSNTDPPPAGLGKPKVRTEPRTEEEEEDLRQVVMKVIKAFPKFNPAQFINDTVKRKDGCRYPAEVYIRVFNDLLKGIGVRNPWAYCVKLFEIERGNVQEERMIREAEEIKQAEKEFSSGLGDLVEGMEG